MPYQIPPLLALLTDPESNGYISRYMQLLMKQFEIFAEVVVVNFVRLCKGFHHHFDFELGCVFCERLTNVVLGSSIYHNTNTNQDLNMLMVMCVVSSSNLEKEVTCPDKQLYCRFYSCWTTYHNVSSCSPSSQVHCPNCMCKICGIAENVAEEDDATVSALLCSLCGKKCHKLCSQEMDALIQMIPIVWALPFVDRNVERYYLFWTIENPRFQLMQKSVA